MVSEHIIHECYTKTVVGHIVPFLRLFKLYINMWYKWIKEESCTQEKLCEVNIKLLPTSYAQQS